MCKLHFGKGKKSSEIEITIQIRDKSGNLTGKTKSYSGESCRDACDWYNKQKPYKKNKRKKKK